MALRLDDILEMWKKDSVIDENNLDATSIDSAKLHSKYLELLSITKLQCKRKEMEFKILLKDKWLWYNGKMTKEEQDERGWGYDPLNGLKILKGEMEHFYNSDTHIQAVQGQIEYLKTLIDTLTDIMDNIKWRHTNIKNIIDWRRFTSGG
jgi:hypothetical protein